MAVWKRLTLSGATEKVDVNIEAVAYMMKIGNDTALTFVGGKSDNGYRSPRSWMKFICRNHCGRGEV